MRRNDDAEDDVQDLEEAVRQTRERVKAAKATKSRAATLRRELQELQEEEASIAASEEVAPAPALTSDPGAFVATSLQSAVFIYFLVFNTFYFWGSFTSIGYLFHIRLLLKNATSLPLFLSFCLSLFKSYFMIHFLFSRY